uniref:Actin-related protein 2/3 complex subunit 5 n=1 Tax=Romanomermis culicivorax TaxID=13658 RepID=A0A915I5L2_ROMCU
MSKNTSSDAFRKIDVDSGAATANRKSSNGGAGDLNAPDDKEVCNFLSRNLNVEALKTALKNPPYKSRDKILKDRTILLVSKVLTSFKQSEIEKVIKNDLDQSEREILMKYVYKSFEYPQENNSAQLLIWHEKLIQQCGLGIIVRVLTDMKRL